MRSFAVWIVCGIALGLSGCDSSPSTDSADSSVLLPTAPEGAISLTEFKAMHGEETATVPDQITLVGKIDAGEFGAFEPDSATFVLSELPDEEHTGGDPDHADNCPFCKRRLANAPKAIVKLIDDAGSVRTVSADKLAGLTQGDVITVAGPAAYDEAMNMITIKARSVHVRR